MKLPIYTLSHLIDRERYIRSYKAGRVHASDAQHDGGRPLREDDFDAVINSLEESTAAIDRHTIQLEEQRNALAQLQALNRAPAQPSTSSGLNINDRLRTQAHLQTEDEDSIDDLRRRVTQAERQSKDDVGSLRTLVHNQLNQDDQLLKSLQTTMRALSAASPQAIDSSGIDKLCSRLVDLRSQCMQNHINSVYEKALSSATDNMYNNDGSSQATTDTNEVAGLEEELDSLMIEATAVLQMVVENEHRRTIDSALAESYFQADKQKQQRIDHVSLACPTQRLSTDMELGQRYTPASGITSQYLVLTRSGRIRQRSCFAYGTVYASDSHRNTYTCEWQTFDGEDCFCTTASWLETCVSRRRGANCHAGIVATTQHPVAQGQANFGQDRRIVPIVARRTQVSLRRSFCIRESNASQASH